MIRHLISMLCIVSSTLLSAPEMPQVPMAPKPNKQAAQSYVLKILPPPTLHARVTSSNDFCGFYKGYQLVFHRNLCVISHPIKTDQFVLLITKQTTTRSRDNNIQYLERIKNEPCRLFYITKKSIDQMQDGCMWQIEEEKTEEIPVRLPTDSLVIFMDPNIVDTVCQESHSNIHCEIMHLPSIKLKATVTAEELKNSAIHSVFASLETDAVLPVTQKKGNCTEVVSLKYFQR